MAFILILLFVIHSLQEKLKLRISNEKDLKNEDPKLKPK